MITKFCLLGYHIQIINHSGDFKRNAPQLKKTIATRLPQTNPNSDVDNLLSVSVQLY